MPNSYYDSENLDEDLTLLLDPLPNSVNTIEAIYSGSGDSGAIDSVNFFDIAGDNIDVAIDLERRFFIYFDLLLEHHYPGWEINEGAEGSLTLNVRTRKVTSEHVVFEPTTYTANFEV